MIAAESDLCILRIDLKTKRASPKDDFRYQVVRLERGQQINLGPYRFSADCVIGQPYGSMFQFDESSRSLKPLMDQSGIDNLRHLIISGSHTGQPDNESAHSSESESYAEPAAQVQRDNRNLVPSNSNQTLAPATITELKQCGADRSALVEQLAQGSKTFAQKSAFSQEKYLRKKQKRHAPHVALLRSCARVACEMQLAKTAHASPYAPDCAGLRVDSLALLLHHSDLSASARVLLSEYGTRGLVAGAIIERIAPATGPGPAPNRTNGALLVQVGPHRKALGNMPQWVDARRYALESLYYRVALEDLETGASSALLVANDADSTGADATARRGGDRAATPSDDPTSKKPHLLEEAPTGASESEDSGGAQTPDAIAPRAARAPAPDTCAPSAEAPAANSLPVAAPTPTPTPYARRAAAARAALAARRASSLVLVCRYAPPPLALARRLWRWLRPSGALVVYCEHQAALVELFVALRDGCDADRRSAKSKRAASGSTVKEKAEAEGEPTATGGGEAEAEAEGFAAVQLELSECFCREMQVLPARTHPQVPFHAFGGYLLTGIKVLP